MMNKPQMTKVEIFEEVMKPYFIDPSTRSVNIGKCLYYDQDTNNKCAVGKCLTDDVIIDIIARQKKMGKLCTWAFSSIQEKLYSKIVNHDYLLKDKYRGHGMGFWTTLQNLHDRDDTTVDILQEYNELNCFRKIESVVWFANLDERMKKYEELLDIIKTYYPEKEHEKQNKVYEQQPNQQVEPVTG